ncbi:MAG: transposase [Cytophagaceae bacterium]|nr:transposase [Cytophagaceae bacterium]
MFIKSFKHSQEHRILEVYSYCTMSSHIHLILKAKDKERLQDIIRDFKRHNLKATTSCWKIKLSIGKVVVAGCCG